jgi:hypothetical protein
MNYVSDCKRQNVRVNTLVLKVCAAVEEFRNKGWKQVVYNREVEDYASFLRRVASLADDEFIQDLHIEELFLFPHEAKFRPYKLFYEGCIILQQKVRLTF